MKRNRPIKNGAMGWAVFCELLAFSALRRVRAGLRAGLYPPRRWAVCLRLILPLHRLLTLCEAEELRCQQRLIAVWTAYWLVPPGRRLKFEWYLPSPRLRLIRIECSLLRRANGRQT